jgi:hypothetical protein
LKPRAVDATPASRSFVSSLVTAPHRSVRKLAHLAAMAVLLGFPSAWGFDVDTFGGKSGDGK